MSEWPHPGDSLAKTVAALGSCLKDLPEAVLESVGLIVLAEEILKTA